MNNELGCKDISLELEKLFGSIEEINIDTDLYGRIVEEKLLQTV